MKHVNTRWVIGGGSSTGERNPTLDKETLKRLALDMGANTSVRTNSMKPTLVISYDDSVQEDYTLAFPVHQTHNVPAEINAISDFMLGQGGYLPTTGTQIPLTQAQALEMQEAGWEFSAHGRGHLSLGRANIRLGGAAGTSKIYVDSATTHRWTHTFPYEIKLGVGDQLVLSNPTEINTIVSSGEDVDGTYLVTGTPLGANYNYIRLSDAQIEDEIKGCIDDLTGLGLHIKHHSAPYSASNWAARKIIKKYLLSARRGNPEAVMVPGGDVAFPTYQLGVFIENTGSTHAELDAWLDGIASSNGLAILMEHTWRSGFSVSGLDYIITGAKARGIDITTRTEALKRFGNLLELGDPYAGEESTEADQPYYIVDRTGKVFENINDLSDVLDMPY